MGATFVSMFFLGSLLVTTVMILIENDCRGVAIVLGIFTIAVVVGLGYMMASNERDKQYEFVIQLAERDVPCVIEDVDSFSKFVGKEAVRRASNNETLDVAKVLSLVTEK